MHIPLISRIFSLDKCHLDWPIKTCVLSQSQQSVTFKWNDQIPY